MEEEDSTGRHVVDLTGEDDEAESDITPVYRTKRMRL